jgi:hypothetical protein
MTLHDLLALPSHEKPALQSVFFSQPGRHFSLLQIAPAPQSDVVLQGLKHAPAGADLSQLIPIAQSAFREQLAPRGLVHS